MRFRQRSRRDVGIDLSPLIDVLFLLLIFFSVSTTFLQVAGLELDLPESEQEPTATLGRDSRVLTIELAADGTLALHGEPATLEQLEERLARAVAARPDLQVVLRADREARHGRVVSILDAVRRSGARGLSVATRLPERRAERGQPRPEPAPGPARR